MAKGTFRHSNKSNHQKHTPRDHSYDDFRETLATPLSSRTYRSEADIAIDSSSATEQIIRFIASLLTGLLALRFLTNLITADTNIGFVDAVHTATNWLVAPMQTLFGRPPVGGANFIDVPALATIAAVIALAALIIRLLRPRVD
jgi:hypothetical protein